MEISRIPDRRRFLAGLGAVCAWPGAAFGKAIHQHGYFGCGERGGIFFAACLGSTGKLRWTHILPDRGHGLAVHPSGKVVAVFARRAGTFTRLLDAATGAALGEIAAPQGRHFFGHGVWLDDDRLAVSGNDFEGERGVIMLWDTRNPQTPEMIGEWPSHGVGPHDLAILPEGNLVVANGGILTHPDFGRAKLNIPQMLPSLAVLNARSGKLLSEARLSPDLHKLSIRHLDVRADGTVLFGAQYQGPKSDRPLLAGLRHPGGRIHLLPLPDFVRRRTQNYIGSVSFDASGSMAAASCPRGGMILLWNIETDRFIRAVEIVDGCGLVKTGTPNEILVTSGRGEVVALAEGEQTRFVGDIRWDNHLAGKRESPVK